MGRIHPPIVALLERCIVRYQGRALAKQRGGRLLAIVKTDGSVTLQDLEKGVKPQFYNPHGCVNASTSQGRLRIHCESRSGEILYVSGVPLFIHEEKSLEVVDHIPRRRVEGLERDLVKWIQEEPSVIGLSGQEFLSEVYSLGGRVDLQAGAVVVEVKKHADIRTFDQAQRYLRDPTIGEIRIVCISASKNLIRLCDSDQQINLVFLDEIEFKNRIVSGFPE